MREINIFKLTLVGVFMILLALILSGCKSTEYIPFETVRTEYKEIERSDSIHIKDSIFVFIKGDTVFRDRVRTEYRDRVRTDSVIVRDSIQVPYPVEVIKRVEKELCWWQKTQIYLGNILLIAGFGWLFWKVLIKKMF